ncbi:hypothetical protein [Polyangium fumosum]|uniref:XRE family transcriptional regulator n=1 Tax=Polyangium fumosum TaxID=889272 RepID=A0A4U1JKI7_9BACT|nr:hypothetical protein [Polyangium fumosum]TKD12367.1 hypothetical protein E8A74_04510 [Polyangium fumosum]
MNDLTNQEEAHVRAALQFLRLRFGGWASLAKALRFKEATIAHVANGKTVSASLAIRISKLVNVGVDDLLRGNFPPPGTCPYCGHQQEVGQ